MTPRSRSREELKNLFDPIMTGPFLHILLFQTHAKDATNRLPEVDLDMNLKIYETNKQMIGN